MADSMSSSFKAGPRGRRPRRQNPWRSLPSCEARVLDGGTTLRTGILHGIVARFAKDSDAKVPRSRVELRSSRSHLAICKKRRKKFRYAAKYGISSPQRSLGGGPGGAGPHYRDEKNTPFNYSVLNTKLRIQVQELELELELELEQKRNSGDAAWRPGPCSQFNLFTFRQ